MERRRFSCTKGRLWDSLNVTSSLRSKELQADPNASLNIRSSEKKEQKLTALSNEQRKLATEKLRMKFEARRREREGFARPGDGNISHEKQDRVKEYYANLDREDKKLEDAKPAPKPFKSSLASSLKAAVPNTLGSVASVSGLKRQQKIIYSIEQLRR